MAFGRRKAKAALDGDNFSISGAEAMEVRETERKSAFFLGFAGEGTAGVRPPRPHRGRRARGAPIHTPSRPARSGAGARLLGLLSWSGRPRSRPRLFFCFPQEHCAQPLSPPPFFRPPPLTPTPPPPPTWSCMTTRPGPSRCPAPSTAWPPARRAAPWAGYLGLAPACSNTPAPPAWRPRPRTARPPPSPLPSMEACMRPPPALRPGCGTRRTVREGRKREKREEREEREGEKTIPSPQQRNLKKLKNLPKTKPTPRAIHSRERERRERKQFFLFLVTQFLSIDTEFFFLSLSPQTV